ncbi:hypothetical protein N7468_005568 [Penicillium chermesinum]|uniref:J domain-containing protein n=1 Tax=Penicillium chermesinum TaxID=63820 RepID=A0A9W9TNB5_9EURO|nr:uncharacterized protein N7468_005568 [Penicillium chermesinum]KAJ5232612.1 hypothetical protein N7468_005568 [Penicillium chermesinum]
MPPHSLGIARCLGRSATPRSVAIPTTSSRLKPARHLHVLRGVRIQPALAPTPRSIYQAPHELGCRYASTGTPSEAPGNASTKITGGPDITTYYSIFPRTIPAGPPPASPFEISSSDLRREFLQLQGTVHPDKYPSGEEKQHAEALSARINEAYRTLVDPLQRAQYLLREWHGIDVTAEDASTKHALDPETLMEVMEVQETIEEVGAAPEAEAEIEVLKKDNDARIKACVEALGKSFDKGDIEAARKECIRLRFWYSVGEGLREWEPGKTEIRLVHGS